MLQFLYSEQINQNIIRGVEEYHKEYTATEKDKQRLVQPRYHYCSMRGYTLLNVFKSYQENKRCINLFNYCASGWNRDGLALRGARQLMGEYRVNKRILFLLMLSLMMTAI